MYLARRVVEILTQVDELILRVYFSDCVSFNLSLNNTYDPFKLYLYSNFSCILVIVIPIECLKTDLEFMITLIFRLLIVSLVCNR